MDEDNEGSNGSNAGRCAMAQSFDDEEFDLEVGACIPTIDLSEHKETREDSTSFSSDDENDASSPDNAADSMSRSSRRSLLTCAVATPVGGILATRSVESNHHQQRTRYRRAEFISAAVIKPSSESELGLSLKMRESGSGMEISVITPNGLISKSGAPLRVGDKIVSVNNFSCDRMDNKHAAKLLREAEGTVTIVVQNAGGDPRIVESMIAKPAPNHPTGIGFASTDNPPQLNVSRIFAEGLFAQSLLSIGDEVISVNAIPCQQLDSAAAADIIKSAPQYVTVKVKKFEGQGVVIASNDDEANLLDRDKALGLYGNKRSIFCFFVFMTALVVLIMYLQFF